DPTRSPPGAPARSNVQSDCPNAPVVGSPTAFAQLARATRHTYPAAVHATTPVSKGYLHDPSSAPGPRPRPGRAGALELLARGPAAHPGREPEGHRAGLRACRAERPGPVRRLARAGEGHARPGPRATRADARAGASARAGAIAGAGQRGARERAARPRPDALRAHREPRPARLRGGGPGALR